MKAHGNLARALLLIVAASGLAAQAGPHVIRSLTFSIDGSTRERAIRDFLGLREGLEFPSAEALESYLDEKRRELVNDRVFRAVEIDEEAEAPAEGVVGHKVTIHVVDSDTFAPLPNLSYDSNLGLQLGVQLRYDNAFGTMTNWFFDGKVVMRDRDGAYGIGPWALHPRFDRIMLGGLAWTLDMELQREERQARDIGIEVATCDDYKAALSIGTRMALGGRWRYEMEPGIEGRFGTVERTGSGELGGDFFGLVFRHALGLGQPDWIGNFRSGYGLLLEQLFQAVPAEIGFELSNELSFTAAWYLPWSFLNYYGRARIQANSGAVPADLGKWLRGIIDDTMSGTAAVFLNQSVGIDLGLPGGIVDLQLHPFFDAGTALPSWRRWNPATDMRMGAGADILLFFHALPNIFVRCTLGLEVGTEDPLARPEIVLDTTMSY